MMSGYRETVQDAICDAADKMFAAYVRAVEPIVPEVKHMVDRPYAVVYCDHSEIHIVADMVRKSFVALVGTDVVHCYAYEIPEMLGYHPRACSAVLQEMEGLTRMYEDERQRREHRKEELLTYYESDHRRFVGREDRR